MEVEYQCCKTAFFVGIGMIILLVLFAGLMSGLTLGLMSMSIVDLEVLAKSGTPTDSKHALKILPVVRKQHLLLCTLLICNAGAMEALPVFLDSLVSAWAAILISVSLILFFGEIIPQAFCTRYGLAIGATVTPIVRILVWICFPVAYPISKLLDYLLGKEHKPLFRRAELQTLVGFHSNEAGKGGELTHDETTIIAGALELTSKKAKDAMTPISETFAIDINSELDRTLMKLILEQGHSRVPVYYEQPNNIIGLILVKNLLRVHPADEIHVKNVTIRKIPRVWDTMPLYDILNEFQKGHSHMAVVVRQEINTTEQHTGAHDLTNGTGRAVRLNITDHHKDHRQETILKRFKKEKCSSLDKEHSLCEGKPKENKWAKDFDLEVLKIDENVLQKHNEEGEAIGIITMEDVIEELLQEEIYDETD